MCSQASAATFDSVCSAEFDPTMEKGLNVTKRVTIEGYVGAPGTLNVCSDKGTTQARQSKSANLSAGPGQLVSFHSVAERVVRDRVVGHRRRISTDPPTPDKLPGHAAGTRDRGASGWLIDTQLEGERAQRRLSRRWSRQ